MKSEKQIRKLLEAMVDVINIPCGCGPVHDPDCVLNASMLEASAVALAWVVGVNNTKAFNAMAREIQEDALAYAESGGERLERKRFEDMTLVQINEFLSLAGEYIRVAARLLNVEPPLFALITYNVRGLAHFASNGDRGQMIAHLRDVADKLEQGKDISLLSPVITPPAVAPTAGQMSEAAFVPLLQNMRSHALGVTLQVMGRNDGPGGAHSTALGDKANEAGLRVKGNRSGAAAPTWDDLRLLWESTLRVCLEELEQYGAGS